MIIEIDAVEVDLEEDCDKEAKHYHKEKAVSCHDESISCKVVKCYCSHWIVEISKHNEDVLRKEQKPADHVHIDIELLLKWLDSKAVENV